MMNGISLTQLIIFVTVAESLSLSQTARLLHLSPSAVSKSLSQLEQLVGSTLIIRTTRRVMLSGAGQQFYLRVKGVIGEMKGAIDEVRQREVSSPSGVLSVTSSVSFSCAQLVSLLPVYGDRYRNVEVNLTLSDRCLDINARQIDVALRISERLPATSATPVAAIHWVFCATPEYLRRHGTPGSQAELHASGKHSFLLSGHLRRRAGSAFPRRGAMLECSCSLALMTLALCHSGIALLPTYLACDNLAKGALVVLFAGDEPVPPHVLYALVRENARQSARVTTFLHFLKQHISDPPTWDQPRRHPIVLPS